MKLTKTAGVHVLALLVLFLIVKVPAQKSPEAKLIEPTRPTIANSAEFQEPGILQVEYGYDGFYRSDNFRSQDSAPLVLRFAAHERLLLEAEIVTVISQEDTTGNRETGFGDSRFGLQVVAAKEGDKTPAVAFAYNIKVPTASSEKGLGTGRTDHRVMILLSKKISGTDVNFNAAYLNIGREFNDRRASGAQAALNGNHEFKNNWGIIGEVSAQSEDFEQPKGAYGLGAVTYKINKRLRVDTGMRFGLTPASPRFGFFAGLTTGIGKPFNK
jgi:hypothetical protein